MPSVLSDIEKWAQTLQYWEQAALDKILAGISWQWVRRGFARNNQRKEISTE